MKLSGTSSRPTYLQLSAFAHVVQEGSFARAARRIGISQSAVSQHVTNLEQAVGAALLIRDRNGVQLTQAGREFFDLADRLVTIEQQLAEKIADYGALEEGHLTLVANSPRPALQFLAAFKREHPRIDVEFTLWDWTSAMRLLRERRVDVAIVTEPRHIDNCNLRKCGESRYMVYVQPEDPLAAQTSVSLRDLGARTVLLPEKGSFTQRIVSEALRRDDIALPRVIHATTFPVMCEAILYGVGVGVFLADGAHPSIRLVSRPIRELPTPYATYIATPNDKLGLLAVKSFLEVASDVATGS